MSETSQNTQTKAGFKDYMLYAVTGAILHPLIAGIMSFLLSMLELWYYQGESGNFAMAMLLASSFFMVGCIIFSTAGIFYSLLFSIIYNNTAHGKANSVSNRFLYNVLFSIAIGIISPIVIFILFQLGNLT